MPTDYANRPYKACFENGIITIDTSKRYTEGLDIPRCGKKGVKIGSTPNASGAQNFPRNWNYSCWNMATNADRDGYVVALHRLALPGTSTTAPEYSTTNNGYSWAAIYAIIEIPNTADETGSLTIVPTTAERSTFMTNIGNALSNDNVNFGTITDTCGILAPGVTIDPACTTDTYCGAWSNADCGGYHSVTGNNPDDKKKCASYSDSTLVAGDTYKRKKTWGGGYTTQTVPSGVIICTYDAHNMPNRSDQYRQDHPLVVCNDNQDKVLGTGWCGTNGMWQCIPKLGCKDLHNTNYAPETQRTHSNAVCTAGTCISGASKMLFGSGDGSCIKSLQTWHLIKSDTGCCTGGKSKVYDDCKCRYELALGRSGWGNWVVAYNNFQGPSGGTNPTCVAGTCDQWYSGRSGMHQFTTLAAAQAAYNTMKAGAEAAVGGTGGTGGGLPTCGDNEEVDTTTNTCGCKSGYVPDSTGACVALDADECSTSADCAECEKCETDTDNVSRCITDPDCTPADEDPTGCIALNRALPSGDSSDCGDCQSGYTENDDGDCEADADEDDDDETGLSPLVIGGMVAGAALLALMVVKK